MTTTDHQVSEMITLYKGLANIYDTEANTKSVNISNYITEQNLVKSLSNLPIQKVLDTGLGSGKWAKILAQLGYEVSILINKEATELSDQFKFETDGLAINYIEGNPEDLPFEKESFDLVLAEGGIFSIVNDPRVMLKEFRRVIKSGGYVWINYLNLTGWSLIQPDIEVRMQLAGKDEESIYMGKDEQPYTLYIPKKVRYMLYDVGFLELSEFGNGILTNPLMSDDRINGSEIEQLKRTELKLSRNYNLIASAFHIQVLAQKIIH